MDFGFPWRKGSQVSASTGPYRTLRQERASGLRSCPGAVAMNSPNASLEDFAQKRDQPLLQQVSRQGLQRGFARISGTSTAPGPRRALPEAQLGRVLLRDHCELWVEASAAGG